MKKLFRYLRRQPKNVRNQYALLFSAVFVLLVAAFWFPAQFGNNDGADKVVEEVEEKQFPFKTLLKTIKDQFATVLTSQGERNETSDQEKVETVKVYQGSVDDFVLPEEEVATLKQKLEETQTDLTISEPGSYQEVLIATTSASSSLKTETD